MGGDIPQPAVFLDRDGTLIEQQHYLSDPKKVVLIETVPKALSDLRSAGFKLIVVTNQSGIARGLYAESDYHAVAKRVDELLGDAEVSVDATFHCPHHHDFGSPCNCRKPLTGMYYKASEVFGIDFASSYFVGDKVSDVLPALELGGTGLLVRTGYGSQEEAHIPDGVAVVDDLGEVAGLIKRLIAGHPSPLSRLGPDGVDPPECAG